MENQCSSYVNVKFREKVSSKVWLRIVFVKKKREDIYK